MTSEHLKMFIDRQQELSTSADLQDRIEAVTAIAAMPVDDFADQLRSAMVVPADWALVDAAVQAASSSDSTWAMMIVLESCASANNPRLDDAVNDSLREVSTSQWLTGKDWQSTTPLVLLRKAALHDDAVGLVAKQFAEWLESAEP